MNKQQLIQENERLLKLAENANQTERKYVVANLMQRVKIRKAKLLQRIWYVFNPESLILKDEVKS